MKTPSDWHILALIVSEVSLIEGSHYTNTVVKQTKKKNSVTIIENCLHFSGAFDRGFTVVVIMFSIASTDRAINVNVKASSCL